MLFLRLAIVSFVLAATFGCDHEDSIAPNAAPETTVDATAIDTPGRTVTFQWNGRDDGDVIAFEWRLSANGADGIVDVADTLGLEWRRTEASDSTFVLRADLPGDDDLFFQTYSFYVRAIDDQERRDPSPAHVSVTATTVAPAVRIRERTVLSTCMEASSGYGFSWEVTDTDAVAGDRFEVRWLLREVGGPEDSCWSDLDFAAQDPSPIAANDPAWSDWVPYVEAGGAGGRHGVASLGVPVGTKYLFAVQARDAAGAVTPTFEWVENVVHFATATPRPPLLTLQGRELGVIESAGTDDEPALRRALPDGFPLDFEVVAASWPEFDAPFDYRWGVDVANPDDPADTGWRSAWTSDSIVVDGLRLDGGSRSVVVQARDRYGVISRLRMEFDVLDIPSRPDQRPLLVVDAIDDAVLRPLTDAARDAIVRDWFAAIPDFDSDRDVIDAVYEPERLRLESFVGYRSIVWLVIGSGERRVEAIGPGSEEQAARLGGSWMTALELYQRHVGNVMIAGPGAMRRLLAPLLRNVAWPLDVATALPFDAIVGGEPQGPTTYGAQAFGVRTVDWTSSTAYDDEGGRPSLARPCDLIASVAAGDERFGLAADPFDAWRPTATRLGTTDLDTSPILLGSEELYDRSTTALPVDPDVVPLMRSVTRRGYAGAIGCPSGPQVEPTPNHGWPVALASTRFAKLRAPGPDLVVGVDLFGFESDDVRAFVEAVVFDLWGAAAR